MRGLPVTHSNDTGFAPGRGAGVGRPVGVEQGDTVAAAGQFEGGPGAETAGPDDRKIDVYLMSSHFCVWSPVTAKLPGGSISSNRDQGPGIQG